MAILGDSSLITLVLQFRILRFELKNMLVTKLLSRELGIDSRPQRVYHLSSQLLHIAASSFLTQPPRLKDQQNEVWQTTDFWGHTVCVSNEEFLSHLLIPHPQFLALFALLTRPQIWRHCFLKDLSTLVSSFGSRTLSEQCLAHGSIDICWMNEHSFTNFNIFFGHKVAWYHALGKCFWLKFVGIVK